MRLSDQHLQLFVYDKYCTAEANVIFNTGRMLQQSSRLCNSSVQIFGLHLPYPPRKPFPRGAPLLLPSPRWLWRFACTVGRRMLIYQKSKVFEFVVAGICQDAMSNHQRNRPRRDQSTTNHPRRHAFRPRLPLAVLRMPLRKPVALAFKLPVKDLPYRLLDGGMQAPVSWDMCSFMSS